MLIKSTGRITLSTHALVVRLYLLSSDSLFISSGIEPGSGGASPEFDLKMGLNNSSMTNLNALTFCGNFLAI